MSLEGVEITGGMAAMHRALQPRLLALGFGSVHCLWPVCAVWPCRDWVSVTCDTEALLTDPTSSL
jgi:hypothetical protein